MNKHFSIPVVFISFFLLVPFHARAAKEDPDKVYKVTEGDYLQALSHVNKLQSQNGLLWKENKHLEQLNGDTFVKTKKAEGIIDRLMIKSFSRNLDTEEDTAPPMLENTQPQAVVIFQKEGSSKTSTRSAEVTSASFFPHGQSSANGTSPQALIKQIAEMKRVIKSLTQQLEKYQRFQKIEKASLSFSEGSQTQAHHEGLKLEQTNFSIWRTQDHQRSGMEEESEEEKVLNFVKSKKINLQKLQILIARDEEENAIEINNAIRFSLLPRPRQENQWQVNVQEGFEFSGGQAIEELRNQVMHLTENNALFSNKIQEKNTIIEQQKEEIENFQILVNQFTKEKEDLLVQIKQQKKPSWFEQADVDDFEVTANITSDKTFNLLKFVNTLTKMLEEELEKDHPNINKNIGKIIKGVVSFINFNNKKENNDDNLLSTKPLLSSSDRASRTRIGFSDDENRLLSML